MIERLFAIEARGSRVAIEIRAGLVTFLTMAYILAVNPRILADTGMPADDVAMATALASAVACLVMGLWANLPFALAPGMGLNAYFTYGVVAGLGVPWPVALAAVFVEGLLFLVLSLAGLRSRLIDAIPQTLKLAITAGIGLFLAFIGFEGAGLVVDHPVTLVTLGDVRSAEVGLALLGLVLMAVLMARRIPGAILWAMVAITGVAWWSGLSPAPERWWSVPGLPRETLAALDFGALASPSLIPVVLAFFFVDILDTAGTLVGLGQLAGFVDREGRFPGSERAFVADAVGTSVGALLGTSTVTTYIESATGVEEGGRTGLTAVVTGALFLVALVAIPVVVAVPAVATAPALILVGAMMLRGIGEIAWDRLDDALPAFLTLAVMPLTYSIAHGISAGILGWVAIRWATGRWREVGWPMGLMALFLVFYYGWIVAG